MNVWKYICILFLLPTFLQAQTSLKAELENPAVEVGSPFTLKLTLETEEEKIVWPYIEEDILPEVVMYVDSGIDTLSKTMFQKTLQLIALDSGYFAIPPFVIYAGVDSVLSNPLLLKSTFLQVDTTQAVKEFFDIQEPVITWQDYAQLALKWAKKNWYYIVLAAILIIALIVFLVIRNRRNNIVVEEPEIIVPPIEIAIEQMEKLKSQELWQHGNYKHYYQELTDIIRTFLENEFEIHALEKTTSEILGLLKLSALSEANKNELANLLQLSDLVKFAKQTPLPQENLQAWEQTMKWFLSIKNEKDKS